MGIPDCNELLTLLLVSLPSIRNWMSCIQLRVSANVGLIGMIDRPPDAVGVFMFILDPYLAVMVLWAKS